MLNVAGPLARNRDAARYESWSRKVLDGTSKLRDYDATIEWLQMQPDTVDVIQTAERHRRKLWRQARATIILTPPADHSRLARLELDRHSKVRLEKRFLNHVERLEEAVTSAAQDLPSFGPEERHFVRRKLRRLKYLKEMGLPRRKQKSDKILKRVVQLQTAMGDHQNLVNARLILSRILRPEIPVSLEKPIAQQKSQLLHVIDRGARALSRCRPGSAGIIGKQKLRIGAL
jgi:hypothetical protein